MPKDISGSEMLKEKYEFCKNKDLKNLLLIYNFYTTYKSNFEKKNLNLKQTTAK